MQALAESLTAAQVVGWVSFMVAIYFLRDFVASVRALRVEVVELQKQNVRLHDRISAMEIRLGMVRSERHRERHRED